jgi:hypothetical protein
MSKNIVDTVVGFSHIYPEIPITFIPSRRQIEWNGGYVNQWTTADFSNYVKSRNPNIQIERDHGGCGQGVKDDDGFTSFFEDTKHLDILHLDPWKKYRDLEEGIHWTIDYIIFCHHIRPDLLFEIGTEESIRPFSVEELEHVILSVMAAIPATAVPRIRYLVIQCGTALKIGTFDSQKLTDMLSLAKKYNMIAKEHNGDCWVDSAIVREKERLGLTCVNIAQELGSTESMCIVNVLSDADLETFYQLCLESETWVKWVDNTFDFSQKEKLICICGHYLFSDPIMVEIFSRYPQLDSTVQRTVFNWLKQLYGFA